MYGKIYGYDTLRDRKEEITYEINADMKQISTWLQENKLCISECSKVKLYYIHCRDNLCRHKHKNIGRLTDKENKTNDKCVTDHRQ